MQLIDVRDWTSPLRTPLGIFLSLLSFLFKLFSCFGVLLGKHVVVVLDLPVFFLQLYGALLFAFQLAFQFLQGDVATFPRRSSLALLNFVELRKTHHITKQGLKAFPHCSVRFLRVGKRLLLHFNVCTHFLFPMYDFTVGFL